MLKLLTGFLLGLILITFPAFAVTKTPVSKPAITPAIPSGNLKSQPKFTLIELGSINCVPCKMMKPVLAAIEKKYRGTVKVVFHDVWTTEGAPIGRHYQIRAIPTQVFLDVHGKEFFRHEGYFPQDQLEQVIQKALNK